MALYDNLKKVEGSPGIYYKDLYSRFPEKRSISEVDYRKIKEGAIELVLRLKVSGRQTHKTLTFKAMTMGRAVKEAASERVKLLQQFKEGAISQEGAKTLKTLWEDYLRLKESSLSPENVKIQRLIFGKHIEPYIGSKQIKRVTTRDLQGIVNRILANGGKPRTAKNIQDYMRPFFNYAIDLNIVSHNPATKLNIPKFDNKRYFEMDIDSARRLFRAILDYPDPLYRGIFVFLIHGRRLNEVLSLQWQNVKREQGVYIIEAEYNKARRTMAYPLTSYLLEVLEQQPEYHRGLVFRAKTTGGKINRGTLRRHWERVTATARVLGMRIHDTRHLIGYLMANDGVSLEAIGKVLGHNNATTTARYSTLSLKTAEAVTDRLLRKIGE